MNIDRAWNRLSSPYDWRVRTRRAVLLTFPVSLPLWMLAILGIALLKSFAALAKPLVRFWNAPRRRRYGYYGYGHQRHGSRPALQLVADTEEPAGSEPMFDYPRATADLRR